jgi:predicted SAM-dependent methyltransferase
MKTFLHVGCGNENKSKLKGFNIDSWKEIRFDINKEVNPDIQGTLLDMNQVPDNSMDAIYSSHNIEHVYSHQIPIVLKEFLRVLNNDGIVVITCPDIQSIGEAILADKLYEPLYEVPPGVPIAPIDILYGLRGSLEDGNEYMAHKCAFTYSTLLHFFIDAGFKKWIGGRRPEDFALYLIACKGEKSNEELRKLSIDFLPGN